MRQIYLLVILSLLIETTNAKEVENREQGGATKIGFNKDDIKDFNSSDSNKSIYKKLKANIPLFPYIIEWREKEIFNKEQVGAINIGFYKYDIEDFNSSDDNKSIDKKIGNEVSSGVSAIVEGFDSSDINKSIDINRNQDLNDWIKKFFRN